MKTRSEVLGLRDVLQSDRFDVCVDMQGALKSAMVGRMAWATVFAGAAAPRERAARWFYKQQVEMSSAHVVEQGCELLGAAVSEELQPAQVTLPMDEMDERWAAEEVGSARVLPDLAGRRMGGEDMAGRAVWARGGGVGAGRSAVCGKHRAARLARGGRVAETSEGVARVVQCSVGQLIALTGGLRWWWRAIPGRALAAALERPVVGIYGPTDPARNGPYGTRSRVLRDAESVTSHKRVREVEAGMLRIEVEEVVTAAKELMG